VGKKGGWKIWENGKIAEGIFNALVEGISEQDFYVAGKPIFYYIQTKVLSYIIFCWDHFKYLGSFQKFWIICNTKNYFKYLGSF